MPARRAVPAIAATIVFACSARSLPRPRPPSDVVLRARVAQAEARRAGGIAELAALARGGTTPLERSLALRGLGRIGGDRALEVLADALRDPDPEIVGIAASSIGVASSLDDAAGDPKLTRTLIAALAAADRHDVEVIEALGRAGDASAQPAVVGQLDDPRTRAAAAIALGRYGRRKIELAPEARTALVRIAAMPNVAVDARRAVAWAFAREHLPSLDGGDEAMSAVTGRLAALLADADPETRGQAAAALGRRKRVKPVQPALIAALSDSDWRVAVEAVRALTGNGDAAAHASVAAAALARFDRLVGGNPTEAHVVLEALVGLGPHAGSSELAPLLRELARRAAATNASDPGTRLAVAWIECRALAASLRAEPAPDLAAVATCGRGGLPDHLRLPLLGELITANLGSVAARRAALATLLAHADPRVRVAGLVALSALWKDGDPADHHAAIAAVAAALRSSDPIESGNAVDAATALYEVGDHAGFAEIAAAVIARARTEREPELAAALFELIGKARLPAGLPACRTGLGAAPVLARAAASCLKALGEPVANVSIGSATPPSVDLGLVIGRRVRWRLTTTRGEIVIALRPDIAPWAVATVATLTRKGLYDGLEFHRVVPNFVAQGGDPSQSGWGGPGFTIPAEPSTGAGFVAGGVGIADAGRDSGGSQWFVMHSSAPHLDGRYSWIGTIESGLNFADALLIGDSVLRARIELE